MPLLAVQIDNNFISFLEYSGKDGLSFRRVDASMEGLTEQGEADEDTRKALEEYHLPEVDYFLLYFIPAFELTLDELGTIED